MQTKRNTFIILMIIYSLLLSGCNIKNTVLPNSTNTNINDLKTNIILSPEKIEKKDYDNLDLSNVSVEFPKIDKYYNLHLYSSSDLTIDDRIESIRKMVEKYFPKHTFSKSYLAWWGEIPGVSCETYSNGWLKYPNVSENKKAIADLKYTNGSFLYESDAETKHDYDAYMLLNPQTLVGTMIKGTGKSITDGNYEHLTGWFPTYTYENTERFYKDSLPNNSYKLSDTEVSVTEAMDFAVDFFNNDYLSVLPYTLIKPEVSAVDICDYKGIYGYRFLLKNTFDGIAFDYNYDLGIVSKMSDGNSYSNFTNEAFMAKSNDIDFWYMQQPYTNVEYDGSAITDIIPLEKALDIMSEKLTKSVTFKVNKVDFVYCPLDFEENSYETTAEAAWRIESFNPNDEKTYMVYVNATNGEIRYLTRS